MTSRITVDVDVDLWEVIGEANDDELIEEIEDRGYTVTKEPIEESETLDRHELDYLLRLVDYDTIVGRQIFEKLRKQRFGQ